VVFGLIYFGIGRTMLPKIEGTVDARNAKVAGDLAAAQLARQAADATEEAWRAKMATARADAQAATAEAKANAAAASELRLKASDAEAAAMLSSAEAAIRTATDAALASIEGAAAEAAQDLVSKLSGAQVTVAAAQTAVREALDHG